MKTEQYLAARAEFGRLAVAMLDCLVQLLEASAQKPAATPAAAAPDIPDAPLAEIASAPDVPDEVPARSDTDFLAALDTDLAACRLGGDINDVCEANKAEIERRGVEQAASDLVERHRQRVAPKPKPAPAKTADQIALEEEFARITKAIRAVGVEGTLAHLQTLWKNEQGVLRTLPDSWQAALAAEKDRAKAQLQQKEAA